MGRNRIDHFAAFVDVQRWPVSAPRRLLAHIHDTKRAVGRNGRAEKRVISVQNFARRIGNGNPQWRLLHCAPCGVAFSWLVPVNYVLFPMTAPNVSTASRRSDSETIA